MNIVYFIAALTVLIFGGITAWVNTAYFGAIILWGESVLVVLGAWFVSHYDPTQDLPPMWGERPQDDPKDRP